MASHGPNISAQSTVLNCHQSSARLDLTDIDLMDIDEFRGTSDCNSLTAKQIYDMSIDPGVLFA